jgi:hypothetical protein
LYFSKIIIDVEEHIEEIKQIYNNIGFNRIIIYVLCTSEKNNDVVLFGNLHIIILKYCLMNNNTKNLVLIVMVDLANLFISILLIISI